MKIIGITGGSGSGKSFFCEMLREQGAAVCGADALYCKLLAENENMKDELKEAFSNNIFDGGGNLNRKALASLVFADAQKLALLDQITHRYIDREIEEEMQKAQKQKKNCFVIDTAILYKSALLQKCDTVVFMKTPLAEKLARIQARDALSPQEAKKRIEAQIGDAAYEKIATLSVDGTQPRERLEKIAREILRGEI